MEGLSIFNNNSLYKYGVPWTLPGYVLKATYPAYSRPILNCPESSSRAANRIPGATGGVGEIL